MDALDASTRGAGWQMDERRSEVFSCSLRLLCGRCSLARRDLLGRGGFGSRGCRRCRRVLLVRSCCRRRSSRSSAARSLASTTTSSRGLRVSRVGVGGRGWCVVGLLGRRRCAGRTTTTSLPTATTTAAASATTRRFVGGSDRIRCRVGSSCGSGGGGGGCSRARRTAGGGALVCGRTSRSLRRHLFIGDRRLVPEGKKQACDRLCTRVSVQLIRPHCACMCALCPPHPGSLVSSGSFESVMQIDEMRRAIVTLGGEE